MKGGQGGLQSFIKLFLSMICSTTFMIGVKDVLISITQREFIGNGRSFSVPVLRSLGYVFRGESIEKFSLNLWRSACQSVSLVMGLWFDYQTQDYQILLWQFLAGSNAVQHGRPHVSLGVAIALRTTIAIRSGSPDTTSEMLSSAHCSLKLPNY